MLELIQERREKGNGVDANEIVVVVVVIMSRSEDEDERKER